MDNRYAANKDAIAYMFRENCKTAHERIKYASFIAATTMVPILIVLEFLRELYGSWPQLTQKIEAIKLFYDIKD
jgi:hypothetical protein